jgi:toxin-antitoxin system PIN domain toxin
LYAYDAGSHFHSKAVRWWENCLSNIEPVGLPPAVVFGFVRIATNPRLFNDAMSPAEAAAHVRAWLAQPTARMLYPAAGHVEQVLERLERLGTAGNLTTDAQIAALAVEHDAVLHTNDTDFARFEGLRWRNPLKDDS